MRDDIATTTGNSQESDGPDITDLGNDVYQIDTRMAGYQGITAGYLIRSSRPCLVETGTSTSAPVVRAALASLGIGADDLATVVVTHIHLDHAGGVGDIAAMFGGAQVVVHEKGARHLADPTRLMASARMVYGDALDVLFGSMIAVDSDRLRTLDEVGVIDLGDGRRLESYYSPGHARHHVGLVDSLSGDLYVGDAAGVYVPETGDLRPATPAPDFDLEVALASIAKFASLRRRGCCSVTTGRCRTWPRRSSGRRRRSPCGWIRPGRRGTRGWISTTRSRRSGSGRCRATS